MTFYCELCHRSDVTEQHDEGSGSLPLGRDHHHGQLCQLQQEVRGLLPHHVHAVLTLPTPHAGMYTVRKFN